MRSRKGLRMPGSKRDCATANWSFTSLELIRFLILRDARVNEGVSLVAQVPAVRSILVAEQQSLAGVAPLVMEGRDIGTVVFPRTPYKFYIDASPEVRALRPSRPRLRPMSSSNATRSIPSARPRRCSAPRMPSPRLRPLLGRGTRRHRASAPRGARVKSNFLRRERLKKSAPQPHFTTSLYDSILRLHRPDGRSLMGRPPRRKATVSTPDDIPSLTVFLPDNPAKPTPAIVICPGGRLRHARLRARRHE